MNGQQLAALPAALTPLLGREQHVREFKALLHGWTQLVTLRGHGGIGKTNGEKEDVLKNLSAVLSMLVDDHMHHPNILRKCT
ncbi:hypothetical protein GCM10008955_38210 [Deinococcus malanensis]|uniref:Uncharacterized protein n=1 Tax=Deinococcus malanensis TaxID=1706855 RepID=A0ABQ2F224_9DEIO|nr:hypothetical protein [Deinococcus malanensis]GGK40809.1 hypothetical protein GCM10008955_38210 [Deinococcus malanensis]